MDQEELQPEVPVQTSPLPNKKPQVQTLSFYQALQQAAEGKRITKLEWADSNVYGIVTNGILQIMIDKELKNWIISDGDLHGVDWVVLE